MSSSQGSVDVIGGCPDISSKDKDGEIVGKEPLPNSTTVLPQIQPLFPKAEVVSLKKEFSHPSSTHLNSCIQSWKRVFPWMQYVEEPSMFICTTCEWGSCDPKLIEIFRIVSPNDVHLVARKLRKHKESEGHQKLSTKRQNLSDLCKYIYPLIKGFSHETTSLESIVNTVTDLAGGTFPGPQSFTSKYVFSCFMAKRIAECVEEDFLNSLAESPFFSVLTLENNEYTIIRWLNNKGESEEHLFSIHLGYPGETISSLTYLERKNIDMKKLVSYTVLSKTIGPVVYKTTPIIQVPVRCPLFELFVNWVEMASFLKELFQQLTVLTKLCKTNYHYYGAFPEVTDLMGIEEPFSHNCIMNERIVNFFFNNIKALREIAATIHRKTRNMDAYGFSSLELSNSDAMKRCALLFPELHVVMSTVFSKSPSSYEALEKFQDSIHMKMKKFESEDDPSDEYVLLSLFNIFLSHVVVTLLSPGRKIIDVLSKKLTDITTEDIEILLPNLMQEYGGTSGNCLAMFNSLRTYLQVPQDCSLLGVLEVLDTRPELKNNYPELCLLSKKVKVLPCYPANTEQSMFNVASLKIFLTDRVPKHLIHAVTIITLEGPPIGQVNVDQVLEMWARKWKAGSACKLDYSDIKNFQYEI